VVSYFWGETMAKKDLNKTPRSQIKNSLRQLWMRSRERGTALKRDKYTCTKCNTKQTMAKGKEFKVEVHHIHGITNWNELIDLIYEKLLQTPEDLETICKACHKELHRPMA